MPLSELLHMLLGNTQRNIQQYVQTFE